MSFTLEATCGRLVAIGLLAAGAAAAQPDGAALFPFKRVFFTLKV